MNNLLIYILESGFCLLVFFLFYQALLKRETFYHLNRAFLLFAISFSVLIPLLKISINTTGEIALVPVMLDTINVSAAGGSGITSAGFGPIAAILSLYLLVVVGLTSRLVLNIHRINKLYKLGNISEYLNYRLVVHQKDHPPFSFFRTIFISDEHLSGESLEDIIEHEKAHIRQFHSVDILISELIIILQWFNPLAWIYKKLIIENHEFLADEAVLNRGYNPDAYQLRIVSQLFGIRSMPAAHNFNQSIIQKRLKMIKKPKSSNLSRLKFLLIVPLALVMFYMFACSSGDSQIAAQETTAEESLVYLTPDEMAEFPGGFMAFRKSIATNILYPAEARKRGVQGKVYIQFIVDEEGIIVPMVENSSTPPPPPTADDELKSVEDSPPPPSTTDIEGIVVVGYRPPEGLTVDYDKEDIQLLIDESIRVIKSITEKWKPGIKDGKPVKTAYTFPINFTLQ
jgi:hypothetical protein